jgi:hypothetical protein
MWELSEEHRSSKGNSSLASNVMLCDSLFFQIGNPALSADAVALWLRAFMHLASVGWRLDLLC